MASSSAHNQQHHHHNHHHLLRTPYGATAAPPPTPSTQPNLSSSTSEAATADALSHLLHRLPPTLSPSLPSRRSPLSTTTAAVPSVCLSEPMGLLSASEELGFFQLNHHSIPSELANSAESVTRSIFELPRDKKQIYFPKNWPLGFDSESDDDDHAGAGAGESFCFDSLCSSESTELDLTPLREFTREMEKLGHEVIEGIASAVGFGNPAREDHSGVCSLLWTSKGCSVSTPVLSGRMYPFVVGLQYQIRCQKYHILTDSGWVSVSPQAGSVLVTVGDISQVWSNGKVHKVRGRPIPANEGCIAMTLLVTLPLDSSVSPVLIPNNINEDDEEIINSNNNLDDDDDEETERMFSPFSFEDYAWRIYHMHRHLLHKDPLIRYRV